MRKIPPKLKQKINNDPYYKQCIRKSEGTCKGRITLEHAFIYAGKQINEWWAIVPVCAYHHAVDQFQDGGDLDKDFNRFAALSRVDLSEVTRQYPKFDWKQYYEFLKQKYGE